MDLFDEDRDDDDCHLGMVACCLFGVNDEIIKPRWWLGQLYVIKGREGKGREIAVAAAVEGE